MFPNEHSSYADDEISFFDMKYFEKSSKTYYLNSQSKILEIENREKSFVKLNVPKLRSIIHFICFGWVIYV